MPVTKVKSTWTSGSLNFLQGYGATDGQVLFGVDDTGLDVKMFGATSGKYVFWDESADTLYVAGTLSLTGSFTATDTALHATTGRVGKFVGSIAAPAHADGYGAVEIDITASGTFAGPYVAASSTWVNVAAAAVPGGSIVTPHNDGIYLPTGITASSAKMIMGSRMQYVADDGANPGSLFLWSTNIYSNVLTAMFDVNAIADYGATTTKSGSSIAIPFIKDATAGTTYYVNIFSS